jgi:hypothetical protein
MSMKTKPTIVISSIFIILSLLMLNLNVFAAPRPKLIDQYSFTWTEPNTQGQIQITVKHLNGCSDGNRHDQTWQYIVHNINFQPPTTSGTSYGGVAWFGVQAAADLATGEVHNIQGPGQFASVDGNWINFAYYVNGILPGQTGTFSFCTQPRDAVTVTTTNTAGAGPAGYAASSPTNHGENFYDTFNGDLAVPGEAPHHATARSFHR